MTLYSDIIWHYYFTRGQCDVTVGHCYSIVGNYDDIIWEIYITVRLLDGTIGHCDDTMEHIDNVLGYRDETIGQYDKMEHCYVTIGH